MDAYLAKIALLLQQSFFILLGFFGMGFLVGFHELGHFLFAKLFKIRVPSFSLGFGPRLISRKIGETDFCLSLIPFGGYVEIAGSHEVGQGEQKDAFATDPHSFAKKPYYQKLFVMFGGILFNLFFAYAAMILLFTTGIPQTPLIQTPVIATIHEQSAAEEHGLRVGDRIVSINDEDVSYSAQRVQQIIHPLALKQANLIIEREGEALAKTITVGCRETESGPIGLLGVEFACVPTPSHSFIDAFVLGIGACNRWIKDTFVGFKLLFSRTGVKKIGGPIMIIAMTVQSAAKGWQIFLLLLALISINLAVLNLIPLPILDGGQILFATIEAVIRRPIPDKVREYIAIGTWLMFIVLFIYLSINDLSRLISPYLGSITQAFQR
ncbi:MAG TPA: site-2 protease family protein [Candidatus Babeliales bacterium]|nr:site-2 protease family protein [Candidatus Babeliales bacterium]